MIIFFYCLYRTDLVAKKIQYLNERGCIAQLNIEKHLILVKNEDKTQEISYCKREGNKYNISFDQGKIYSYGCYNVQWFSNPTILDPSGTVIYQDNMPVSGVEKIFDFGYNGLTQIID